MAKKDINFIRHIKPQVVDKERSDKAESRDRRRHVALSNAGIPDPAIQIEDIGFLTSMIRRAREMSK